MCWMANESNIAAFNRMITHPRRPAKAQLCPYIAPHVPHGDLEFWEAHADISAAVKKAQFQKTEGGDSPSFYLKGPLATAKFWQPAPGPALYMQKYGV